MIRPLLRTLVPGFLLTLALALAGAADSSARGPLEANPRFSGSADAASALGARGVGSSALETVAGRIAGDREPVAHAPLAALAAWLPVFASLALSDPVLHVHEGSPRERAGKTARRHRLPAGSVGRGDWSGWIRTDFPGLGGRTGGASHDGSARILHFGVERSIQPFGPLDRFSSVTDPDGEWLAGVGLGFASASVDTDPAGMSLDHSIRILYPYLAYRDDRKLAHATVGAGLGANAFRHPSFQPTAADQDSLLLFAGLGGAAVVAGRPDRVEILVRTSVLGTLANTDAGPVLLASTVAAYRLRFGLDARHARGAGGGILSPSGGVGILLDGGDGPRGLALEADAGVRFDWRSFSFSARAGTLLMSTGDLERKLGFSGAVRYSPRGLGRGFFLTLSPSCGPRTEDGAPMERALASSGPDTSLLQLSAETGYAFSAAPVPGLVTVFTGMRSGAGETADVVRAGFRYANRGSLALGAHLERTVSSGGRVRPPAVSVDARWSF